MKESVQHNLFQQLCTVIKINFYSIFSVARPAATFATSKFQIDNFQKVRLHHNDVINRRLHNDVTDRRLLPIMEMVSSININLGSLDRLPKSVSIIVIDIDSIIVSMS